MCEDEDKTIHIEREEDDAWGSKSKDLYVI